MNKNMGSVFSFKSDFDEQIERIEKSDIKPNIARMQALEAEYVRTASRRSCEEYIRKFSGDIDEPNELFRFFNFRLIHFKACDPSFYITEENRPRWFRSAKHRV